jgi:hypothetical protein
MKTYVLKFAAALFITLPGMIHAQQIEVILEHTVALPAHSWPWEAAATPEGNVVIMANADNRLYYKMNPGDEWAYFDYDADIYSVGIDDDSLFALCHGNHIEKIYLPSGLRSEPIVQWRSVWESNFSEVHYYYRGHCFPAPPEPTTDILVEGYLDYYLATHSGPSEYHGPVFEWIHDSVNVYSRWQNSVQSLFNFTPPTANVWAIDWDHTNAYGWQYHFKERCGIQDRWTETQRELFSDYIDFATAGPDEILNRGITEVRIDDSGRLVVLLPELAAGQAHFVMAIREHDYMICWTHEGDYRNVFACNAAEQTVADEILCLHADEPRFDLLTDKGTFIGTTDAFTGSSSDIRIIAQHGPNPRFAVKDADTLYIYRFDDISLPVEEESANPNIVSLAAYPNPFNPVTTIRFDLPVASHVVLDVFNINGQKVQSLSDQRYEAGSYTLEFDGTGLSSGLYFARLQTDQQLKTTKLMLVK